MTTRSRHQPVLSEAEFQERLAASIERHASSTSPKLSLPLTLVESPVRAVPDHDALRAQILAKFPAQAFTAHRENIVDQVMPFVDELHARTKGMAFAAAMLSQQVQRLETELATVREKDAPAPDLKICIDEDCPSCNWAERWFSPARQLFGCSKCDYTSKVRDL